MKLIGPVIAFFLLIAAANAGDAVHIALRALCDPVKIATLESDRAANPPRPKNCLLAGDRPPRRTAAGLLTPEDPAAIIERQTAGYAELLAD